MALPKHLRDRQVPSYFLILGAIFVGCFIITFWFLGPSSTAIPGESPLNESRLSSEQENEDSTKHEVFETSTKNLTKFAKGPDKGDSKGEVEEDMRGKDNKIDAADVNLGRMPVEEEREAQDKHENESAKEQDIIEGEPEGRAESKIKDGKNRTYGEDPGTKDPGNKDVLGGELVKEKAGDNDAAPLYQNVNDEASPGTAESMGLELSTENKENPKNWATQVNESIKETNLEKSGNGTSKTVPEREPDEFENHAKNETEPMNQVDDNKSEHLQEKGNEIQNSENREEKEKAEEIRGDQPAVGLENTGGKTTGVERGEEENAEKFKADMPEGSSILEQVQSNRSGHLQAEGNYGEQPENQNRTGQDLEKSGQQPAVDEEKAGNSLTYDWKICNWQGAADNIPCLDNKEAIKNLRSRKHFEHRERHCPAADKSDLCLVPLPKGYRLPIRWPHSRDEVWFNNVPHPKLVSYKKEQNWVRLDGDKLVFPGGGTQFKFGAAKYVESVEQFVADVAWGKHTRVVLDIGCGVASFGGYLFDRDVVTMSFAPKDEHEAQVQLALERGIPAISAVMGTQRLPFPSNGFDVAHCARCRIHWHGDGGKWLFEINRILRPGGYFVWSATPVYRSQIEEKNIWKAMVKVTESMCWKLVVKAKGLASGVGFAIYQKPLSNNCYEERVEKYPPICNEKENLDAAWYTLLESCLQKIPTDKAIHGAEWPPAFPERLYSTPGWLNHSEKSLFGQPANIEFQMDAEHWRRVFMKSYLKGLGIDWASIRNVMDMKAGYGGFAAALSGQPLWVLNVVPIDEPDTLPVIFDRGLLGIYHDWCESFSSYPRSYDLLHADHIFKSLVLRCKPVYTLLEMDRLLRPEGWIIFREKSRILSEIVPIIESLHWDVRLTFVEGEEELLVAQKSFWRPQTS